MYEEEGDGQEAGGPRGGGGKYFNIRFESKTDDGLESRDGHEGSGPFALEKAKVVAVGADGVARGQAFASGVALVEVVADHVGVVGVGRLGERGLGVGSVGIVLGVGVGVALVGCVVFLVLHALLSEAWIGAE